MIPTIVASQLRDTVAEYLRTTFSLRDHTYERALLEFLSHPEHGLFRGPYLDVRLPFRAQFVFQWVSNGRRWEGLR